MIILAIRAARKFRGAIKAPSHSLHCFHRQIKVHSFNYCIILLPHLNLCSVSEGLWTTVSIWEMRMRMNKLPCASNLPSLVPKFYICILGRWGWWWISHHVHLIFLAWSHTSWSRGSYWTITVFSMYEPWAKICIHQYMSSTCEVFLNNTTDRP